MITTSNNIVIRNLEEQIQKNKEDIAQHYATDRALANFGIKVIGQVDNPSQLPDPLTYAGNYGDAYAVGAAAPYHFCIYTRPDLNSGHPDNYWLDVGGLAIIGPQGPPGKGEKGDRGENSTWYAGVSPPMENNKEGDMFLQLNSGNATGNIYRYAMGSGWQGPIGNIKGNTGDKGSVGESSTWYVGTSLPTQGNKVGDMFLQLNNENTTGDIYRHDGISWQGPIGNIRGPIGKGERGLQGPPGQTFHVEGTLASTDQLPIPTQAIRAAAYLIPSATVLNEYDMWVIVGGHNEGDELTWFNAGRVTTDANALKLPQTAPTSTEIVAVDNTGAQASLTVGDGLTVENGALKSTLEGGLKLIGVLTNKGIYEEAISMIHYDYPINEDLPTGFYKLSFSLGGNMGYEISFYSINAGKGSGAIPFTFSTTDTGYVIGSILLVSNYTNVTGNKGINLFFLDSNGNTNLTTTRQMYQYLMDVKLYRIK